MSGDARQQQGRGGKQQGTKGVEQTKFSSQGRQLLPNLAALRRRWALPVCSWPREDRRSIAEGRA